MNTCTYCNYSTAVKHHFQNHLLSQKHKKNEKEAKMKEQAIKLMEENKKFSCNTCGYHTKYKHRYNEHMQSKRHKEKEAGNLNNFTCRVCDKTFGSFNGMEKHQKKCIVKTITENKQIQNVLEVLDISKLLNTHEPTPNEKPPTIEKQQNIVININQINSNNNTQNIQNILNEKCSSTPNLIDYVKDFNVKNDDIHKIQYTSFIEGMYAILIKNMNKLPREKWPIFCVEEQTFVREEDEWKLHDIDKIKEFVFAFYDIIYKKYVQNNARNDDYRKRFMYREIKETMKRFSKDEDVCTTFTEDIIKYFSLEKGDFLSILSGEICALRAQISPEPPTSG